MPLWLAKWPNGDIVLTRAEEEEEVLQILDEAGDPGKTIIAEYTGPLTLEFKAKMPGRYTNQAGYCRPDAAAAPAQPDTSFRQQLWSQRQQGSMCDVVVGAADGEKRPAHRSVLCASCPSLEPLLSGTQAGAEAALAAVPSGQVLDVVLEWLYLRSFPQKAAPREVLPVALALGLEDLARECDYHLANSLDSGHAYFEGEKKASMLNLLELLAFADRHGRARLVRYTLGEVPLDSWQGMRELPELHVLPGPLQAAVIKAATRHPPMITRSITTQGGGYLRGISVSAKEYQAAGGQLTAEELEQVQDYDLLMSWQAQCAAAGGGAATTLRQRQVGAALRRPAPAAEPGGGGVVPYEVTDQDLASSQLNEEFPCLEYVLKHDPPYEGYADFFQGVTQFAHPHIAKEIDKQREQLETMEPSDAALASLNKSMQEAVLREQQEGWEQDKDACEREARLLVAAEKGDSRAAIMLQMGVSIPGVFPGL